MHDFLCIAVTRPDFFENEGVRINHILFYKEADLVHIRKPGSTYEEMKGLISQIDPELHPKLKIHDHFELLEEFDLGGIHLNSRNAEPYPKAKGISVSIHDPEKIKDYDGYEYFFISPIFDSISKRGYQARFDLADLSEKIQGKNAIALGGVTPLKIPLLKSLGFKGGAMLGYFFPI